MPYGIIKIDTITFTNAGVDKSISVSGLVQNPTFTGNVTATGTISGLIVQAPTVTGTTANFASGVYTTQISGTIVKVPAGSAGAPSIQVGVGASVAPGLYGAGTDLLGISTGGAGRIFIDSTGRLGVGTSTPENKLEVIGDGERMVCRNATNSGIARIEAQVQDYASGSSFIGTSIVQNGSTTAGTNAGLSNANLGILNFQNTSAGLVVTNGGTPLVFATTSTERLRIDSVGRVGIGTSSPAAALQVVGTAIFGNGVGGRLQVTTNSNLGYIDSLDNTSTNWQPLISRGTQIQFHTNTAGTTPTERFRIDSSGRVGIGTSNPTKLLQVVSGPDTSSVSNGADLSITTPGLTAAQINSTSIGIGVNGIANNFNGDFHIRAFWGVSIDKGGGNLSSGATNSVNTDSRTFAIRQFAGGTTWDTQFCVNGSGRVGIGISSPTTLLDVNSDTVRLRTARTPVSATATGTAGEICWDANYIYVCTATDTWRRATLSSW
jgi:hypothetical protein